MPQRYPLECIQLVSPCTADWEQMGGDEKRRYCTHCNKFVHDLTKMTSDEAEQLICDSAGDLCARFCRDPQNGQVMTLDYQRKAQGSRRRGFAVFAAIGASLLTVAGWAGYKLTRTPPVPAMPPMMAGGIGIAPAALPVALRDGGSVPSIPNAAPAQAAEAP